MVKEIKDNTLYFDGCNTVELAEKYGTPLYVYSESDLHSRIAQIRKILRKNIQIQELLMQQRLFSLWQWQNSLKRKACA